MNDEYANMTGLLDQFSAASRDVLKTLAQVRDHARNTGFTSAAAEEIAVEAWKHLLAVNR